VCSSDLPARTPIVRAAILSLAIIASELAGRRYDRLTLLGWVMIAVLIWKPTEIFSAGFHLSFGVVAALMTLASPLRARLFGTPTLRDERTRALAITDWCKDLLCASICAWGISLPIVAHHFGMVSAIGVLSTIVVLPAVMALLSVGYLALGVGLVSTTFAGALLAIAEPIASVVLWIAHVFGSLPISELSVPMPPLWWVLLAIFAIAWWMVRGTARAPIGYALTPLLILSAAITWNSAGIARTTTLRLDMLSVGDGTCMLLRSGREAMLYDCGSRSPSLGLRTIPEAVRAFGARTVRTVVISHPNTDHFNALPDCARRLGVREVIVGQAFLDAAEASDAVRAFLDALEAQGVRVRTIGADESLALGNISFEVLSPRSGEAYSRENNNSIVLRAMIPTNQDQIGRAHV